MNAPSAVWSAAIGLAASHASPTPARNTAPIVRGHAGPAVSRPVANARLRVRRIERSRSRSTYWLNAPAAAEASVTASTTAAARHASIAPGAIVDGPAIFSADLGHEVDNMEGIDAHVGNDGETVITMISDDNYSMIQRNLLLQFTLVG